MVNFAIFPFLGLKAPPLVTWTKPWAVLGRLLVVLAASTNTTTCPNFVHSQSFDLTPDLVHVSRLGL